MLEPKLTLKNTKLHWYGKKSDLNVLIYIHGFSVDYASRGLFTDLAKHLNKSDLSSVLFNLNFYDEVGNCVFSPLSDQQVLIREVYQEVLRLRPKAKISFIAHSMGCGVISSLLPELKIDKLLLLAPAGDLAGLHIKKGMIKHFGATVKDDLITFKRSNNKTNLFSERYVREFTIKFSQIYEKNWPKVKNLQIYLASEDKYPQLEKVLAENNLVVKQLNCDHNFSQKSRLKVLELATDFLLKK